MGYPREASLNQGLQEALIYDDCTLVEVGVGSDHDDDVSIGKPIEPQEMFGKGADGHQKIIGDVL
jgi:hypothetical protein